jgi:hypothetical protein
MPVITEAFFPQYYVNPVTGRFELTYQPRISIFLKIKGLLYPFKIQPFVDSGATRNLFPADPFEILHIPLDNGQKRIHYGIGDAEVLSYTHDVDILIGDLCIRTEIDFSAKHKAPLLGIEKFFEFFDHVNFNMERGQIELRYTTKKNN